LIDDLQSDADLIAKTVAQNDASAFEVLVRRYQSQARNFLRSLSGAEGLADDLAQDSFLLAWNKLQHFSGQGSFASWLLKIAYTTFLQSKRRSKRYDEILDLFKLDSEVLDRETSMHDFTDLERLLAVLPEQERAVLILAYAFSMSHSEISETTQLPLGTVKSMISRGKQTIRRRYNLKELESTK
jgi:RNA polymerase sigma factor (sigma-70 family)